MSVQCVTLCACWDRRKVQSLVDDALGQRRLDTKVVYDYDFLVSNFSEQQDKLRWVQLLSVARDTDTEWQTRSAGQCVTWLTGEVSL